MSNRTKSSQIDHNNEDLDVILDNMTSAIEAATTAAAETYTHPATHDVSMITDAMSTAEINAAIAQAIASLADSAPETLNTLNELAAALGDDPNFATSITNLISEKTSAILIRDTFPANNINVTINNSFIIENNCVVDVYPQIQPQGYWTVSYVDGSVTITSDTIEVSNIPVIIEVRKIGA